MTKRYPDDWPVIWRPACCTSTQPIVCC